MVTIKLQQQQVERLLVELGAHRWDNAVETFVGESPSFEDVPANARLTGKSGIARGYQEFASAFPDLEIEVVHAADVPSYSIRELVITGTHRGTFQGVEPTGRPIRLSCACMFEFDSRGQLATERIYYNNETLLQQVRGQTEPYLPRVLRVAA